MFDFQFFPHYLFVMVVSFVLLSCDRLLHGLDDPVFAVQDIAKYLVKSVFVVEIFFSFSNIKTVGSSVFILAIITRLLVPPSTLLPREMGVLGLCGAETDTSDQSDSFELPSYRSFFQSGLAFLA